MIVSAAFFSSANIQHLNKYFVSVSWGILDSVSVELIFPFRSK